MLRELKNKPLDVRAVVPEVSSATARIFHRMLAPDPAKRFSSYDELVAELQKAQRTLTGEEEEGGERKRTSPWLIGAALLILAAIAAGIFTLKSKPAPRPAQNATPAGPAVP